MITTNKHEKLKAYPHYTDNMYEDRNGNRIERNLYVKGGSLLEYNGHFVGVKGASYDYSDRIPSWVGYEVWNKAIAYADAIGNPKHSAAWFEDVLCASYQKDIEIVHVVAGIDGGGYPYQVFGYITEEENDQG